jgi:hypothetical protein
MYIGSLSVWQKAPSQPMFGAAKARPVPQPQAPAHVITSTAIFIQDLLNDRKTTMFQNVDLAAWSSEKVNCIHPQLGMSILAAAIWAGRGDIIDRLLENPNININLLYPLRKAPEELWQKYRLRSNRAFLESLPTKRGDGPWYSVLDLLQFLAKPTGNGIWVNNYKLPPRIQYPSKARREEEMNRIIGILREKGAKTAKEIVSAPPKPASR